MRSDPVGRAITIIVSARKMDRRVVAVEGWDGMRVPDSRRGDDVLVPKDVPHAEVMPRASAAIPHGSAGTVHAIARSGTPSIVVPFLADQPLWARRLHSLNLAPRPIPPNKLTNTRLESALAQSEFYREEAERVGDLVRSERGLDRALEFLESLTR